MTGNDLLVYIWFPEEQQTGLWIPIGCTKTHEIQVENDTIEVSSPTTGKWKENIDGRTGWSITINYLVLSNAQVKDLLQVNKKMYLSFCPRNDQENGVEGYAILKRCDIRATRGSLVTGTFLFIGTGELAAGQE